MRYTAAFCHALRIHLREGEDVEACMRNILTEPDIDALLASFD